MEENLDRKPEGYQEEKDERWVRTCSTYHPITDWGKAYKAKMYPNKGTKSVITRTNPTLTVYER